MHSLELYSHRESKSETNLFSMSIPMITLSIHHTFTHEEVLSCTAFQIEIKPSVAVRVNLVDQH